MTWIFCVPIHCPSRSEEHTSELQSRLHLVCRLLLEKKKYKSASLSSCRRPHSSRSRNNPEPRSIAAANGMVCWAIRRHPVSSVLNPCDHILASILP